MSDTENILGTPNSFRHIERVKLDIVKAFDDPNFIDDPNYTEDEYNSDTSVSSDTEFDPDYFPCFYEYCDQDGIKSCVNCDAHMCRDHYYNGKELGEEMCSQCAVSYLFIRDEERKKDIDQILEDIDGILEDRDEFVDWNKSIVNKISKTKKSLTNLEDQTNILCAFVLLVVLFCLIYNLTMTFVYTNPAKPI